ncbi:MAG: hypothetical protein A2728_00385 [Candidatus Spechtbacteria bacterium RIFCSPHIGHO2_01_FULL_38_11]|nr:MAG: hypothetical protein A2728_00385 [Candidatus Spechtbacteria bacterium RIFCSPHIGHO2_01_FULL_38_11]
MKEFLKPILEFFGGITRDDKSIIPGTASNIEELDIFSNKDFIQAEQIMSAESISANSEIYAYDSGDDDTVYAYGRKTDTTAGTVRLFSVATGGASNPGNFSTLFTSADTTNLATRIGDLKFFRSTEASNATSLYYIGGTSATWYFRRYNIGAAAEQIWNGSAWAAGSSDASSDLTGLVGSFDRPTMKVIFGELFICHGRYIAKVAGDGTFTEKAFTLPSEWEAIDIIPVSDVAIILARNKNKNANYSKGFWWDLTSTSQFDDSFNLPIGGPQWIFNHKETIKIMCAINGIARFFQMSGAFPGAVPIELPGMTLSNIGTEASTSLISAPKMIGTKDKILYFGVYKTDKTGIYAIGQLDSNTPVALILSKRFHTTDYSAHTPTALFIHGPNYYGAFSDNGTETAMRCESLNSPTRSSNAVYESIWQDIGKPFNKKQLTRAYITSYPLSASTSLALSIAVDYSSSYTALKRADDTIFNTANGLLGLFRPAAFNNKYVYKVKVAFTSSTTNSPKLTGIGLRGIIKELDG